MTTSSMQVNLDIDKISTSVEKELRKLPSLSNECCIYKIPDGLQKLNDYKPQVVSIGPIHYRDKKLAEMEEQKTRYLKDFLQLTQVGVGECITLIQAKETNLRNCYAESIKLNSSENFIKMILVDAAFIIMVLLKSFNFQRRPSSKDNDHMFKKPKMMKVITFDLLLLENQLPFFILEDLYKLSNLQDCLEAMFDLSNEPKLTKELALIRLTHNLFQNWITDSVSEEIYSSNSRGVHLLDFLRISYISSKWNPERKKLETINTPSVKQLHQAGVKFKVGSDENIFDITFKDGVLKIPVFKIYTPTKTLFQNLLAFELYHGLDPHFSHYIAMMVQLVKTPKDGELLIENSIIENWASNIKQISTFFKHLDSVNPIEAYGSDIKQISYDSFPYSDLIETLNKHYEATWPKWKENLKQKYCKTPWAIVSVIAAAILLILTIIQTVCSIIQVA